MARENAVKKNRFHRSASTHLAVSTVCFRRLHAIGARMLTPGPPKWYARPGSYGTDVTLACTKHRKEQGRNGYWDGEVV